MMGDEGKKKSMISIIMGKSKPSAPVESEEDHSNEEGDMGLESAAEEILSAIEAKSAKDLVAALENFIELCDKEEESESPETESQE